MGKKQKMLELLSLRIYVSNEQACSTVLFGTETKIRLVIISEHGKND